MSHKKNIIFKILKNINIFTVLLVALTANSTCIWICHQREFPAEAKKYII